MGGLDACITGTPLWRRMTFVVAPKDAFLSPHGMRILYRLTVFFIFMAQAVNEIDEVWQQISCTGIVGTGRNL